VLAIFASAAASASAAARAVSASERRERMLTSGRLTFDEPPERGGWVAVGDLSPSNATAS